MTATRTKPRTRTPSGPTTSAPERSLAQRMEALGKADEIRTYRAQLKRDLKARRKDIITILSANEVDPKLKTMKLFDLMLAVPKYGRVKVNKIFQLCRISHSKTIGGLSERQRGEVTAMLRRG